MEESSSKLFISPNLAQILLQHTLIPRILPCITLTILFGGGSEEPKEEVKTEQSAPAQAPVIVNVQQNQENKQKVENGGNTVIRERIIEKPAPSTQEQPKPKKEEEDSW